MLVNIAFGVVGQTGHAGGSSQPMFDGMPSSSEDLTSDTTTTATAPAASNRPVALRITTDTAIYVAWGAAPDSSSGARIVLQAGQTEYFGCKRGDKVDVTSV